jgi:hypothetical protein
MLSILQCDKSTWQTQVQYGHGQALKIQALFNVFVVELKIAKMPSIRKSGLDKKNNISRIRYTYCICWLMPANKYLAKTKINYLNETKSAIQLARAKFCNDFANFLEISYMLGAKFRTHSTR